MVGIFSLDIAKAIFSELKTHRSSIDPPPLANTSKSYLYCG